MSAISLAFEQYGEDKNPPLIILHGFFASARNWRQIAKKCAEKYHVYVVDLRNHGLSPQIPEMSYPLMAEDLNDFSKQQHLEKVHLLGHSMGGKVAMWFALNYPEFVLGLVVADISPETYKHSFDKTINALKQLPLAELTNRKQAEAHLAEAIPELAYRQFLLQNLQLKQGCYSWRVDLEIFHQSVPLIVAFPKMRPFKPFKDKVLFIMGGRSNYTNRQAINQHFLNAKIVILDDANHWLHIDQPEAFLKAVFLFLT